MNHCLKTIQLVTLKTYFIAPNIYSQAQFHVTILPTDQSVESFFNLKYPQKQAMRVNEVTTECLLLIAKMQCRRVIVTVSC